MSNIFKNSVSAGNARSLPARGFTLMEVVIAIGVLSIGVLGILMVAGPMLRNLNTSLESTSLISATTAYDVWVEQTPFDQILLQLTTGQQDYYSSEVVEGTGVSKISRQQIFTPQSLQVLLQEASSDTGNRNIDASHIYLLRVQRISWESASHEITPSATINSMVIVMQISVYRIPAPDPGLSYAEYKTMVDDWIQYTPLAVRYNLIKRRT